MSSLGIVQHWLRWPGLYTPTVTGRWTWAAQGRACSWVRQLCVAQKKLTAKGSLQTTLPAPGTTHPSLKGIWAIHLGSTRGTSSVYLPSAWCSTLSFDYGTHSIMLSTHFDFCQTKVKVDFYHLPPRKPWLISSSQVIPQNNFSRPLALKCLHFSSLPTHHATIVSWASTTYQTGI